MRKITISVPGKLILMGEHAVVYGKPCIVVAVSQRMQVAVEKIDETVFRLNAIDLDFENYQKPLTEIGIGEIPKEAKFAEIALLNFTSKYKIQSGVEITTRSDFSAQIGFGSSAAVAVGVIKSAAELFGLPLSQKEIFNLAYKTVLDVQGKGSGFDVAAAIYGGTLYFQTGGSIIEPLQTNGLNLVIGYSGVKADTVTMMNQVLGKMKNFKSGIDEIFNNIEKLVSEAKIAILDKDWQRVGTLMNYNQNYLEDLGVSTDKLNIMIEAAIKAGAYGAKLSGAGGGDCMIALVAPNKKLQVSYAIAEAGGQIININVNAPGVKVENL